jgi:hypothetical protein
MPHTARELDFGLTLHDQRIASALLSRFADHHQVADAVTLVLGILASEAPQVETPC